MKRAFEKSVVVYRASNELEARFIVSILKDNGIECILRVPDTPAYDGLEMMWLGASFGEISVLESDLKKAQELIGDSAT